MNSSELEDWLERVNMVSKQVNDIVSGKADVEEIERQEKVLSAKKKYEIEKKKIEEKEKEESILKGRSGKGHKENYKFFCGKCFIEYIDECKVCRSCDQATIPMEERRAELLKKAEQYQKDKNKKKERLQQWQLWKKTKAMFWKKSSTDYEKWEYFTDSEDEFEKAEKEADPIVPENDPSFQALKSDMDQRAAKIKLRKKEGNDLKEKANIQMGKKNYVMAIDLYSQALDKDRGNKYLWTNRALANIKAKRYDDAIADCTRVLESAEILEDGYLKSKDACFKALCRRAIAYKHKEEFTEALQSIEEALKLFPDEDAALNLKKDLVTKADVSKTIRLEEDKWAVPEDFEKTLTDIQKELKKEVDTFVLYKDKDLKEEDIALMKEYDFSKLYELTKEENKSLNFYFFQKGGLETLKRFFKTKSYRFENEKSKLNYLHFIHVILHDNHYYMDQLIQNNFVSIILKRIFNHFNSMFGEVEATENPQEKEQDPSIIIEDRFERMVEIEEFTEFLVLLTESHNIRYYLREKSSVLIPVFKMAIENLPQKLDDNYHVISSVLTLFGNLLVSDAGAGSGDIKDYIIRNHINEVFIGVGKIMAKSSNKYLNLKKSCMAFVSNFLVYPKVRSYLVDKLIEAADSNLEEELSIEMAISNPSLYFFQNLIKSCIHICENSIKKHKKFADNTRKLLENVSGVFLNLSYKLDDKTMMEKVTKVLNEKDVSLMSLSLLEQIMTYYSTLQHADIMCKRYVCIFARYYCSDYTGRNTNLILMILIKLLGYYKDDDVDASLEITMETTKLIVTLLQKDLELKDEILDVLSKSNKLVPHTIKTIQKGSEEDKVR